MNRASSFELLRLLLMLMIVVHHCIVVGLGLEGLSPNYDSETIAYTKDIPLLFMINNFCIVAVNVFVLLSGFFGIKVKLNKVLSLLFAIYFYTILFSTLPSIMQGNAKEGLLMLAPFSHQTNYWFLREYFILMLFSPLLNDGLEKYTKRNIQLFLIGMAFLSCYLGFVYGRSVNTNGYNFVNFIFLYVIGGYLKRYSHIKNQLILPITAYLSLSLLNTLMCIFFYQRGSFFISWKLTYYNNPLVLLASVALFLFFCTLNIESQTINRIAKSSLSIYLFGCATTVLNATTVITKELYLTHNIGFFLLLLLGIAVSTGILSIIIDQIRLYMWNLLTTRYDGYIKRSKITKKKNNQS